MLSGQGQKILGKKSILEELRSEEVVFLIQEETSVFHGGRRKRDCLLSVDRYQFAFKAQEKPCAWPPEVQSLGKRRE